MEFYKKEIFVSVSKDGWKQLELSIAKSKYNSPLVLPESKEVTMVYGNRMGWIKDTSGEKKGIQFSNPNNKRNSLNNGSKTKNRKSYKELVMKLRIKI